jgi:hypothetical protein
LELSLGGGNQFTLIVVGLVASAVMFWGGAPGTEEVFSMDYICRFTGQQSIFYH